MKGCAYIRASLYERTRRRLQTYAQRAIQGHTNQKREANNDVLFAPLFYRIDALFYPYLQYIHRIGWHLEEDLGWGFSLDASFARVYLAWLLYGVLVGTVL